jgi:hypothetical protein
MMNARVNKLGRRCRKRHVHLKSPLPLGAPILAQQPTDFVEYVAHEKHRNLLNIRE